MNTLFIFGLGYSATHFAKQALAKGWTVRATSRELKQVDGIEIYNFDGETPLSDFADKLDGVTHILNSIPPHKDAGDCVYNLHKSDLEELSDLKWMGYLSTTGVYGNADGALVSEDSPRNPGSARSKARKQAEDDWFNCDLPLHVFRLAGIYGPNSSIFNQIKAGRARAISKPGQLFSRIHIDDIAGVLWASIGQPNPKTAYNLCDDAPTEPVNVLAKACEIMGAVMPEVKSFDDAAKTMSPMALTFWQDNKRVDNSRIKTGLNYKLIHPGYEEGLQSIWAEENK